MPCLREHWARLWPGHAFFRPVKCDVFPLHDYGSEQFLVGCLQITQRRLAERVAKLS
jgi:hypothetical protein